MGSKRIVGVLAALTLLTAACGDDVDQNAVDQAVDDLTDATGDDSGDGGTDVGTADDTADDTTDNDTADDTADETAVEPPVGVSFADACMYLMHFPHPDFPEAPYHAILFTQADGLTAATEVAGTLPDREVRVLVADGTANVYWPVFEPGTFDIPTITAAGFAVDVEIANTFLHGTRTFPAVSADIGEELLEPDECEIPIG